MMIRSYKMNKYLHRRGDIAYIRIKLPTKYKVLCFQITDNDNFNILIEQSYKDKQTKLADFHIKKITHLDEIIYMNANERSVYIQTNDHDKCAYVLTEMEVV